MGRGEADQATRKRGRIRRFLGWLGFGPESEDAEEPNRNLRRERRKARVAERRATRRVRLLERQAATKAELHELQRARAEAKSARAVARAAERARRRVDAERARHEAAIEGLERELSRAQQEAAAALDEHHRRLAEIESRARAAERRAERARGRVASAQERAGEARAVAKEARRGIDSISTRLARIEAERRRDEQEEWRLELECAELRGRLDQLRARVGEQIREAEQQRAGSEDPELGARTADAERSRRFAPTGGLDGRSAAIEERARAAADQVMVTQRNLARAADRLRAELERRIAEEDGYAKATNDLELAAARRRLAEARRWVPGPGEPVADSVSDDEPDPLRALEASLEGSARGRDGSQPLADLDQLPAPRRTLFGRIRSRLTS